MLVCSIVPVVASVVVMVGVSEVVVVVAPVDVVVVVDGPSDVAAGGVEGQATRSRDRAGTARMRGGYAGTSSKVGDDVLRVFTY